MDWRTRGAPPFLRACLRPQQLSHVILTQVRMTIVWQGWERPERSGRFRLVEYPDGELDPGQQEQHEHDGGADQLGAQAKA